MPSFVEYLTETGENLRRLQASGIEPRVEPLRIDIAPDGKAHVRVHQFVTAKDGTVLQDKKIEHVYTFDGPFVARMDIVDRDPHPEDDEDDDDE